MMTYLCKYTPLELMISFGSAFHMPNNDVHDFSKTETVIHSSVCAHARMLLMSLTENDNSDESQELILTNCCDSIRRVYDVTDDLHFSFRHMLDLPHKTTGYAVDMYAKELSLLIERYQKITGHSFDRTLLLDAWKKNAESWQELLHEERDFIAVIGARTSDELFQKIRSSIDCEIVNLTCGGLRSLPLPPDNAAQLSDQELLHAYADALLRQIPCTRMEDAGGRSRLLQIKGLRGIVYHSVRFCDYYSFEYAELRRTSDLPMLKIESDYTSQSEGQLVTRIAAFNESLVRTASFQHAGPSQEHGGIYVGIDSGSTTTNLCAVDDSGQMVASAIIRTGAKAGKSAERGLEELKRQLGADAANIRRIIATGYGREFISFADAAKTEISCHAKGAHTANSSAATIIDIGGQDSKVICLDEDGNVINFIMNDKCAAGTGRFLEMMAHTLEISLDEMSGLGLKWKHDLNITSTCTVFAESEVVSLIAENSETGDIIHALNKSVAQKTMSMVKRAHGKEPYMMTGGVARNRGVVGELQHRLGSSLFIMEEPDLIGAYGAALFALESR